MDKQLKHSPVDINSKEFISAINSTFESLKSQTLDDMIVSKYGKSAMDTDFPDLSKTNESNLIFEKIRGNTRLMDEAIMTQDEADKIINQAIKANF
jgi:hypothetical protein